MPNFAPISYETPLRIPPQKKRKPNETNHLYYNKAAPFLFPRKREPIPSYPFPLDGGRLGWG